MKLKNNVVYLVQWRPGCEGLVGLSIVESRDGNLYDYTVGWYGEEREVLRAVELDEVIEVLDRLGKWIHIEGAEDE